MDPSHATYTSLPKQHPPRRSKDVSPFIKMVSNMLRREFLIHETVYGRGVKLIFTGGHISLAVAFKGPRVISTP